MTDQAATRPAETDRQRAARLLTQDQPDRPLVMPVSTAQRALWLAEQRAAGATTYRICRTVVIDGPLDVPALQAAVGALVARHEALRTVVESPGGVPLQRIMPPGEYRLPVVTVASATEAERLAEQDTTAPFDLATGPLFRATLLRLAPDRHHLLLSMHHVVVDGVTLLLVLRDLGALYAAAVSGEPASLPPAGAFRAAVLDERRWLAGAECAQRLDEWRDRLAGLPPQDLDVAGGRRPAGPGEAGLVPVHLPAGAVAALRAARPQLSGATVSQALLAAYAVLLHRYTGQTDLAVGVLVANRGRWPDTAGCFTDSLVVRLDLAGNPPLRQVAAQVRDAVLDGLWHRQPPLERIADAAGGGPLFAAVASLLTDHTEHLPLPGVRTEVRTRYPSGAAKFPLNLQLSIAAAGRSAGAHGTLGYDSALVDAPVAAGMARHLATLAASAAATPDRRIGHLPLLSAGERAALIRLATSPETGPSGTEDTVADRFTRVAADRPDAAAVLDPTSGTTLRYDELARRAERLAGAVAAAGVRRGHRVGLLGERSADLVVATVALALLGATAVPLDPGDPPARLAGLAADAGLAAVVTTGRAAADASAADAALAVPVIPSSASGPPARTPGLTGLDRLYVMYTSGSTGSPKGVVVPHRAVLRLVSDAACVPPGLRWLLNAPTTFDASTLELWGPLLTGGTIVTGPPGRLDLDTLAGWITRHGVQAAWLTAGLFHAMVDHRPEALRSLRLLLAGGDTLSAAHVRRAVDGWDGTFVNGYGPTENTTFTTRHVLPAAAPDGTGPVPDPVPIGRPVPGSTAYLVDAYGNLVPHGAAGELVTGGTGLAEAYTGRPAETAARFVPDPFGPAGGQRLYRTGDRCRWRSDGTLEFLGRDDDQLKVRGFRVEPAEVEAAVRADPLVRDAAVAVRQSPSGDRVLVGYVVGTADPDDLDRHCERTLARHLRPALWVRLDELPLTGNGKVDRRALPDPAATPPGERLLPGVEQQVAAVWQEILGVPVTDRGSNFFELGGHSLSAARIVARLRADVAPELELRTLFEHSTLSDFAVAISTAPVTTASATSGEDL